MVKLSLTDMLFDDLKQYAFGPSSHNDYFPDKKYYYFIDELRAKLGVGKDDAYLKYSDELRNIRRRLEKLKYDDEESIETFFEEISGLSTQDGLVNRKALNALLEKDKKLVNDNRRGLKYLITLFDGASSFGINAGVDGQFKSGYANGILIDAIPYARMFEEKIYYTIVEFIKEILYNNLALKDEIPTIHFLDLINLEEGDIKRELTDFIDYLNDKVNYLKIDDLDISNPLELIKKEMDFLKGSYFNYAPPVSEEQKEDIINYNTAATVTYTRLSFIQKILEELNGTFVLKEDVTLSIIAILLNNMAFFKKKDLEVSQLLTHAFADKIEGADITRREEYEI